MAAVAAAPWAIGCDNGGSSPGTTPGIDAGTLGSGGSASSAGGSSGGSTDGGSGAFDGYWKALSSTIIVVSNGIPTSLGTARFAIPPTTPFPDDGRDAEIIQQFTGDNLVTYAFIAGNPGYFRVTQPLLKAGSTYSLSIDQLSATEIFQMSNGQLTAQISVSMGTTQTIASTTFTRLDAFPPSGWPALEVSLP